MDWQPYQRVAIISPLLALATTGCAFITASLNVMAQPAIVSTASMPKFQSVQGKFAITFPQQPRLQQKRDSNGHTIYNFVTNEPGRLYLVSYFDQPGLQQSSRSSVEALLLKIVRGFTEGAEMKLVRAQPVSLGKHPGREFRFTGSGAQGKGRTYLVGSRVYLLVGVDNGRSVNSFLNSFRLL